MKKETPAQVFSCDFCKISKNTFFKEHLQTIASAYIMSTENLQPFFSFPKSQPNAYEKIPPSTSTAIHFYFYIYNFMLNPFKVTASILKKPANWLSICQFNPVN